MALLANGGRLIDAAYMYGNEEAVGESVRKEMEKYGIAVLKPQWTVLKDRITCQYITHNPLWDVEVDIKIVDKGITYITISLSASFIDDKGQMAKDAIGVYKMASELVRENRQLVNYRRNHPQNTILL
jgi:hypothetical protein